MSGELAAKFRLVRCPRCKFVLTEYPHFDLYKCGGCGTTLQAKRTVLNHVSEDGEPNNPTKRTVSTSSAEHPLDENNGGDRQQTGLRNEEQPRPSYLSDEQKENDKDMNALSDVKNKEHEDSEIEASPEMVAHISVAAANDVDSPLMEAKELNSPSDSREDADKENAPVEAKSHLDITGSDPTAKSSVPEKRRISHGTSYKIGASTSSGNPVFFPKEKQKQAMNGVHHSFNSVRSVDTIDTAELAPPIHGEFSKTLQTRSYHANGSISSYDEMNGGFSNQCIHPFENPSSDADNVAKERPRRGKIIANSMKYRDHKTQNRSTKLPSDFLSRNLHVTRDRKGKQIEAMENTRHGRPVQDWTRRDMNVYPSRMPFHSRSGYESADPSNRMRDELCSSSGFLSHYAFEYQDPDQEKIKLMRMIYKLQNQLNRTNFLNGQEHIPANRSHDLRGGRYFHGSGYSTCNGMCSNGTNRQQRQKFSRIPFSAESTSRTHNVDRSYPYCSPSESQWSAQLPPRVVHRHEELRRFHPSHKSYLSHSSGPSNPRLQSYGTKHYNLRRRAPEVKQKQTSARQHMRSVAGGAPFVTCHNCFQLLQLPADFLLFKRACHQLRCGACSDVLKFSLQNRIHIVPYAPNASGPSPK